jgi:hypothetical protein
MPSGDAVSAAFVHTGRIRHRELAMSSSGERFCDVLTALVTP